MWRVAQAPIMGGFHCGTAYHHRTVIAPLQGKGHGIPSFAFAVASWLQCGFIEAQCHMQITRTQGVVGGVLTRKGTKVK